MTATDRLPAILAALCDALTEADDLVLASGVAQAMDLHELAPLLPVNATDIALARGLHGLLADGNDGAPLADADRAIACRVAARLASTACLLLAVDPVRSLSTAEALWSASGKLSGLWEATHKAMRAIERAETERGLGACATVLNRGGEEHADLPVAGARPVQVGEIIDAKDVPPGTLVDRQTPDGPLMTIRMPNGFGYHLSPDDHDTTDWWPRQEMGTVRVLAIGLRVVTAARVATMTPSEAREWLAQRVAAQPVGGAPRRVKVKGDGGWTGTVQESNLDFARVLVDGETTPRVFPCADLSPL